MISLHTILALVDFVAAMTVPELDMLTTLLKVGPVVMVMGVVMYFMFREIKTYQTDIKEMHVQTRERDKETLNTLQALSNVLTRLSDSTNGMSDEIRASIHDAAETAKSHVTERTAMLSEQIRNQRPNNG